MVFSYAHKIHPLFMQPLPYPRVVAVAVSPGLLAWLASPPGGLLPRWSGELAVFSVVEFSCPRHHVLTGGDRSLVVNITGVLDGIPPVCEGQWPVSW